MRIGILNLKGQVVAAPMAGVSNRPFRLMALEAGAALTYTEMISSEGIIRRQAKTLAMMKFQPNERPIGIQIFGANPQVIHRTARIIVDEYGPDLIDINLGCPAKKVVSHSGGAAVLKDLVLTEEIIRATVEGAGQTPVTLKIRTGWDDANPVYEKVGQIAEKAGAAAVTLHARSRSRGFSGQADWTAIKKLKESIGLPVIGNGDVKTPGDARRMLQETGCDGVMIGRAARGNLFIFKQVNHYLATSELLPEPAVSDKIIMARHHAWLMAQEFGEPNGIVKMRGCLGRYVKGFRGASELRQRLLQAATLADISRIFEGYLNEDITTNSDVTSAASRHQ